MVTTGAEGTPGINGGMLKKQAPTTATTNTIDVESVEGALAAVKGAGGKMVVPKD